MTAQDNRAISNPDWDREFGLVVMTGHASQELVEGEDEEIHIALVEIRLALTDSGQFVFETRNPLNRAWERWETEYSGEVIDPTGTIVRGKYKVEMPVEGDVVHSINAFTSSAWNRPLLGR